MDKDGGELQEEEGKMQKAVSARKVPEAKEGSSAKGRKKTRA